MRSTLALLASTIVSSIELVTMAGTYTITVPAGGEVIGAYSYQAHDINGALSGAQDGTLVFKWIPETQSWTISEYYAVINQWYPALTLNPGEGFIVRNPTPNNSLNITVAGTTPSGGSSIMMLPDTSKWYLVGSYYPVSFAPRFLECLENPSVQSLDYVGSFNDVVRWNTNGILTTATRGYSSWQGGNPIIPLGYGMWIKPARPNTTWTHLSSPASCNCGNVVNLSPGPVNGSWQLRSAVPGAWIYESVGRSVVTAGFTRLCSAAVHGFKVGNPSGSAVLQIWSSVQSGGPPHPGVKLAESSRPANIFPTTSDWVWFEGLNLDFSMGEMFWVVLYYPQGDISNHLIWNTAGSNYVGTACKTDSPECTWENQAWNTDCGYLGFGTGGELKCDLRTR